MHCATIVIYGSSHLREKSVSDMEGTVGLKRTRVSVAAARFKHVLAARRAGRTASCFFIPLLLGFLLI